MKRLYFMVLLCIAACVSSAQTREEWLQQKKTRIRYLVQQVASFQMYIADLKKGYATVTNGLNVIGDSKHCDFNMHNDYFNSLSSVSGTIRGYDKVHCIAEWQAQIIEISTATWKLYASPFLFPSEKSYITATINGLLQQCAEDMDKLHTVTTSGAAQIWEKQRLVQINSLYESAQDKYSFAVHLKQSIQQLVSSRGSDKTNASRLYSLYGLK